MLICVQIATPIADLPSPDFMATLRAYAQDDDVEVDLTPILDDLVELYEYWDQLDT